MTRGSDSDSRMVPSTAKLGRSLLASRLPSASIEFDSTDGAYMTAEARICPRCSSEMVLRTAGRGRYEGQQFWGCSTYPKCRAVIGIKGQQVSAGETEAALTSSAGASAQARYERSRQKQAERVRRGWPLLVGVTLVLMLGVYLFVQAVIDPVWGGVAALLMGLASLVAIDRLDVAKSWRVGAEGERKTASYLAGLEEGGFIVRHDRRVPGYGGNVDHIAIGPTGVWVIETKSYRGGVEVYGDRLEVNGQPRDKIVDQVYKQAIALQIALGDRLSALGVTVTPVLCLHRAKLGWAEKGVRGVRIVDGRGLAKLVRMGESRLSEESVQQLAAEVDRLFRPMVTSASPRGRDAA